MESQEKEKKLKHLKTDLQNMELRLHIRVNKETREEQRRSYEFLKLSLSFKNMEFVVGSIYIYKDIHNDHIR